MNTFPFSHKEYIFQLLSECNLPTNDLNDSNLENFLACGNPHTPSGVIGIEVLGENALLRSLAVKKESRRKGYAQALVSELEKLAKHKDVKRLYLLTQTAELFFKHLGYQVVERALVPKSIQSTQEYSSICPANATVMSKAL
ncbi:arsenic resistance N-acetyltransferase ArsN2 [Aliikangiella sp. IMCC44359]|uniref:arsenic resistance N-acetyltransferase ArsN2 n=1 Tax=Aliikangiella sp. IMCC44359 TaxID=3459125 RepID=UPI00403A9127